MGGDRTHGMRECGKAVRLRIGWNRIEFRDVLLRFIQEEGYPLSLLVGQKMRDVETRMCSVSTSKLHLTFYQNGVVAFKFLCFKSHDINANHYHYSCIMHAVDSTLSVLTVLRASHALLLNFGGKLSQRHLQCVLHTVNFKNHKIISRAAANLQRVYHLEKNNLPLVQSLPNKQISTVRGRICGSKIIEGRIA